ncbi:hypothetical protein GOBAR_DD27133 [Gossypium barbadense]|nr:hypothetical protein GOBAR_DD27133 [Gossypium barbadense]
MLCSIPTAKSGSNWLDRLRSSKGFPTGDNLDLDHFLANPNPSDSPITNASDSPNSNSESTHSNDGQLQNPKPPPPEAISSDPEGDKEWFGIMRNVLSELFNMGEQAQTSRFSRKKASRKQTNPRICTFKTPEEQKSSSDNVRNDKDTLVSTRSSNSREESKEEGENNNLIFRRKNIWKVKDKKGKSRTIGRKKRKTPPSDLNNVGISNKKPKISSLELRSLKETSGRECGSPANHCERVLLMQTNDWKTHHLRLRMMTHKFPFSRLPRKSGKGSSVILMKAIPTGKKNGAKLAKNGLKDSQRQYKT